MLRACGPGPSLWESLLPPEVLRMPTELARVDELLDDPALLEPFRPFFDPLCARRSIPMETFLRLMWLNRGRLNAELQLSVVLGPFEPVEGLHVYPDDRPRRRRRPARVQAHGQ